MTIQIKVLKDFRLNGVSERGLFAGTAGDVLTIRAMDEMGNRLVKSGMVEIIGETDEEPPPVAPEPGLQQSPVIPTEDDDGVSLNIDDDEGDDDDEDNQE